MAYVTAKYFCQLCSASFTEEYAEKATIDRITCPNCRISIPADENSNIASSWAAFNEKPYKMPVVKEGEPYGSSPWLEDLASLPTDQEFFNEVVRPT